MSTRNACEHRPSGGRLRSAISNAVMRIIADYTGHGPTGARTTLDGDWIFVTVEESLTRANSD